MAAATTLSLNKIHHLRPHLDFFEGSGGVVSSRSCWTVWLGFPRMRRRGGGGAASRGFCSQALAPSRWRFLRRRREAWRSCPGVKMMAAVRCFWRRRWPSGEDGGSGAGWWLDGGRFAGFPRSGRRVTADLGSDLQHGEDPRSTLPNAHGSSVCEELLLRSVKPATAMVLARIRRRLEKTMDAGSSRSFSLFFLCCGVFLHLFLDVYPFQSLPEVSACVCLFCMF
jgi:hypothetical protein